MYKLIAIDLDGTLLNSKRQVPVENIETIREVVKRGIRVVICSGRIFTSGNYYAGVLGSRGPIIACNGSIIKDSQTLEVLYDNPLSQEDSLRIVDVCHREKVYFYGYAEDILYAETLEYDALYYWRFNKRLPREHRVEIKIINNFSENLAKNFIPVSKFVVISDDAEQLAQLRKYMEKMEGVTVVSSAKNNFEIFRKGVSKGNALKMLSQKLDIDRKQIVAIGDNENDYTMIEYAGLGIAMGNAENMIKDIAQDITLTNDENGVSEALKRHIL